MAWATTCRGSCGRESSTRWCATPSGSGPRSEEAPVRLDRRKALVRWHGAVDEHDSGYLEREERQREQERQQAGAAQRVEPHERPRVAGKYVEVAGLCLVG